MFIFVIFAIFSICKIRFCEKGTHNITLRQIYVFPTTDNISKTLMLFNNSVNRNGVIVLLFASVYP